MSRRTMMQAGAYLGAALILLAVIVYFLAVERGAPRPGPGAAALLSGEAADRPYRRYLPIDWAAARAAMREQGAAARPGLVTADALGARLRRDWLDRLTLPVLLPAHEKLVQSMNVTGDNPDLYTCTMRDDGILIEMVGARIAAVADEPPVPAAAMADERTRGHRIERTEDGLSVSFSRFGAAYNIGVICEAPQSDPRCTRDAFVEELMGGLRVFVGRSGEAAPP